MNGDNLVRFGRNQPEHARSFREMVRVEDVVLRPQDGRFSRRDQANSREASRDLWEVRQMWLTTPVAVGLGAKVYSQSNQQSCCHQGGDKENAE